LRPGANGPWRPSQCLQMLLHLKKSLLKHPEASCRISRQFGVTEMIKGIWNRYLLLGLSVAAVSVLVYAVGFSYPTVCQQSSRFCRARLHRRLLRGAPCIIICRVRRLSPPAGASGILNSFVGASRVRPEKRLERAGASGQNNPAPRRIRTDTCKSSRQKKLRRLGLGVRDILDSSLILPTRLRCLDSVTRALVPSTDAFS